MPENNDNQPIADITVPENNEVTVRANEGGQIRVLVMKNDGSGQVNYQNLPEGATVRDAVGDTGAQQVRVNGQPADANTPLHDNDKVSATPRNIDGA